MSGINPKRVTVFVCVMATIAIFIHSAQSYREQQKAATVAQQQLEMANEASARRSAQEAAAKQAKADRDAAMERAKAIQDAAAMHAKFLAQNLNTGFTRKSGVKTVAVAVASENGEFNHTVTDALASRFKAEPVEMLSSFFKPAFVSDGVFNTAFAGSSALFEEMELKNSLDALLLAREDVQYSSDPSLQNVITATMRLDIAMWTVAGQAEARTWTFTTAGAGFKREAARALAEERLVKKIAADTNMYLVQINQNH
jgi:hypothetical protein